RQAPRASGPPRRPARVADRRRSGRTARRAAPSERPPVPSCRPLSPWLARRSLARMQPRMHESWLAVLGGELEQPYMTDLRSFLVAEVEAGRRFYPPADRVFNALSLTPFDDVRVVILGQDPYHGAGQ